MKPLRKRYPDFSCSGSRDGHRPRLDDELYHNGNCSYPKYSKHSSSLHYKTERLAPFPYSGSKPLHELWSIGLSEVEFEHNSEKD